MAGKSRLVKLCKPLLWVCLALLCAIPSLVLARVDVRKGVDKRLLQFAAENGLRITAGRNGKHNVGSKHYKGLAIDVSCHTLSNATIEHLKRAAHLAGLYIRDERTRPKGQAVWGGPHLHIEVP